jgi:hypothetical protein
VRDLRIELEKLKFTAQVLNNNQDKAMGGRGPQFSSLQAHEHLNDLAGRQSKRPRLDENIVQDNSFAGGTRNTYSKEKGQDPSRRRKEGMGNS